MSVEVFFKTKRVKSEKNLKRIRNSPCLACGKIPSDVAHIKSKGSGGGYEEFNLIPLCRSDHIISHKLGWARFLEMHPHVKYALEDMGWQFQEMNGKFLMFHS